MPQMQGYWRAAPFFTAISLVAVLGWVADFWAPAHAAPGGDLDGAVDAYAARMRQSVPVEVYSDREPLRVRPSSTQPSLPERQSLLVSPSSGAVDSREALVEVPDPSEAPAIWEERVRRVERESARDPRILNNYRRTVTYAREYLSWLPKGEPVRLSLSECVQRTLENNFLIRREAFGPAISQTRIVEAEAAFDAEFFLDSSYALGDRPTASELASGRTDVRQIEGGFRKLLPSGMQASVSLGQSRSKIDNEFVTLNPAYESTFRAAFNQPLLRNFGLDYNRRFIILSRLERDISHERFVQQVRDVVLEVERTYWLLVRARREVAVLAESVGQNRATFENMKERLALDATVVEVNNAEARWKNREVEYREALKNVRDAQDRLKNLMNDPDFKLSVDVEIIPTDPPLVMPIAVDQFEEVRTALEHRSEIRQAQLAIEQARVETNAAKNQTLPRLDLNFTYEVQGLEGSADVSFDKLTTNRHISYSVGVQFSYPLGNRGPRAAHHRARLQERQLIEELNRVSDSVVEEVNAAVRTLAVRFEQVAPQLQAARAADLNLRALQARAQAISPAQLETELSGLEQLANTRRVLLQILTDYNVAIVELERAKGTLLDYNNVVIAERER